MLCCDFPYIENRLKELTEMGDRLARAQVLAFEATQQIENLERDIQEVVWQFEFDVNSAVEEDEDGQPILDSKGKPKPKFSNDSKRKAEVKRLMAEDENVQKVEAELKELKRRQFESNQIVWRLKDDRTNIRTELGLFGAQLTALADPVTRELISEHSGFKFAHPSR